MWSLWNGVTLRIFTRYDAAPFWVMIVAFLCTFDAGYGPVQGIEKFWRIPGVSNITWSANMRNLTFVFFLIGFL
jgi:hypothetical protein